jgi:catechol 2,3-dioxygenase
MNAPLHPAFPLRFAAVRLQVADVARSTAFYADRLGFAVIRQTAAEADLGFARGAPPVLTLAASPRPARSEPDRAGLFHAAVLLPSAPALGAWLNFATARDVAFDGFSDHGVSEAIYLSDPDGNGLEFSADRNPADWPRSGEEIAMTTRPLALRSLLAGAAPASNAPLDGARWGHLHLRVTDLERSEAFYCESLGLAVTQRSYPGVRFLAADGYHHHVALNVWGRPRRPVSSEAPGLAAAVFLGAGPGAERGLVDPDGQRLIVRGVVGKP